MSKKYTKNLISQRTLLLIIFVTALLFRVVIIFTLGNIVSPPTYEYGAIANNIVSGNGFSGGAHYGPVAPTAFKAPIYPYFLAAIYKIFGENRFLVIEMIHAILGACTCVIIYFVTLKIYDNATATLAGIILALYPIHAYLTQEISSAIFFTFFISILLLTLLDLSDSWKYWKAIVCGLIIGLTALLNPAILAFVPFALLWLFINLQTSKVIKRVYKLGMIVIVAVITVAPWTIRNYIVLGKFIPIKSQFGINLWRGNNEYATGITLVPIEDNKAVEVDSLLLSDDEIGFLESLNEVERYKFLGNQAKKFMINNPKKTTLLTLQKFRYFWFFPIKFSQLSFRGGKVSRFPLLRNLIWGTVLITGVFGISISLYQRKSIVFFLLLFVSFSMLYMITLVDPQYRRPIEPEMCIFSAYSLIFGFRVIRSKLHNKKEKITK